MPLRTCKCRVIIVNNQVASISIIHSKHITISNQLLKQEIKTDSDQWWLITITSTKRSHTIQPIVWAILVWTRDLLLLIALPASTHLNWETPFRAPVTRMDLDNLKCHKQFCTRALSTMMWTQDKKEFNKVDITQLNKMLIESKTALFQVDLQQIQ